MLSQKAKRSSMPKLQLAQFLWNNDRPKEEEAISDWVKIEFETLHMSRGIILNREVQIHIRQELTFMSMRLVGGHGTGHAATYYTAVRPKIETSG